ncbi:hypothetical protein BC936DRAFT_141723 [Jimgerdemannia flammicorona]|nr:hypothetical protein BC936DRAFT_141723 [Jimgerdemannia flammicorona]
MTQIHNLKQDETLTVYIDYEHLQNYDESLAKAVAEQYYRFMPYLRRAVQNLVRKHIPTYLYVNSAFASEQRGGQVPREFDVAFYGLPAILRVRELRTEKIGQLISISGTVTRTSEVRPELLYGSFTCVECGMAVKEVEQQFKYTEPTMCQNPTCHNRLMWDLNIEQSRFVDWQRVRIQENANEIPTGSMPRSMDAILRNEIVERAKAGDKCVFTGTLIAVPDIAQIKIPGVSVESQRQRDVSTRPRGQLSNEGVTGLRALGVRDLNYKLSFMACMVQPDQSKTGAVNVRGDENGEEDQIQLLLDQFSQEEIDELRNMVNMDKAIYGKLVNSIAPTVFGHDTVKKGILLQLMGGVHKVTPEGINLRGDINVCIVGDPSTSKSQFLK